MKSLKKMADLADKFERKLRKFAGSVGSTDVTLAVRPK